MPNGLPASNRFAEEFFDEAEDQDEGAPRRRAMLILAGALGVLVLIGFAVVLISGLFGKKDVRLEKHTAESESRAERSSETTASVSKALLTIHPDISNQTTLTPLGTDPYQNPPAYIPTPEPTEAPTELPTEAPTLLLPEIPATMPPTAAPPPVVIVPTQPEVIMPPETAETSAPVLPPADPGESGGESVEEIPAETPAGMSQTTEPPAPEEAVEELAVDLPAAAGEVEVLSPNRNRAQALVYPGGFMNLSVAEDGSIRVIQGAGDFAEVFTSGDSERVVAVDREGRFLSFAAMQQSGTELPMLAARTRQELMGSSGFGYIMDQTLYYYSFLNGSINIIAPGVTDAIAASATDGFLYTQDGGVYYKDQSGDRYELLTPGNAVGGIHLIGVEAEGRFAVFEDDAAVYVFRPQAETNVMRFGKWLVGSAVHVQRTPAGDEVMLSQAGSELIIKQNRFGEIQQIMTPVALSENALFIPAGKETNSPYDPAVILDQGILMLHSTDLLLDAGTATYGVVVLGEGVKEAVSGGNAVYWTDRDGRVIVTDAGADLTVENPDISRILSSAGSSRLTAAADGSAVFYLQGGKLWKRETGAAAEILMENIDDFVMNRDGSRIYGITAGGGLLRLQNGALTELLPDGSGADGEALKLNSFLNRGGNRWLDDTALNWFLNGNLGVEP